MTKFSVLDLVRIPKGSDAKTALDSARTLAVAVEHWGYHRYWVSEHHNILGIASAATSVVLAHIAAATNNIRVGAGGIMLPNHTPIIVAEHFGTLATLYPNRVDLGVGRADGSVDRATAIALRGNRRETDFQSDIVELQRYFATSYAGQPVQAVPAAGTNVPLWILGTSTFGAELAAKLGLPYSFGSHLAPDLLLPAIEVYREHFRPSMQLKRPYVMVSVNVAAAYSNEEAKRLATTRQMSLVDLLRGELAESRPPIDNIEDFWTASEKQRAERALAKFIVGSPDTVRAGIETLLKETGADELIAVTDFHDQKARLRSHHIFAECMAGL